MRFTTDPFEEMERLFDQTRRSMRAGSRSAMGPYKGGQALEGVSSADVSLRMEPGDDGYVVTADMPGFEKGDIDLRFEDGVLTVRASVEVTAEDEGAYSHRARHVAEQVLVPGDVIEDDIEASYRNGVLEVHLPTAGDTADDVHRIDID